MLTSLLLGKPSNVCRPSTIILHEGGFFFDHDGFSSLVKGLEERPKSDIMFEKLYDECDRILHHHGRESLLALYPFFNTAAKDGYYELRLSGGVSSFFNDSSMAVYFREKEEEKRWHMRMIYRGDRLSPFDLMCFDGDRKLTNRYDYD